jgi:hypothetical protein
VLRARLWREARRSGVLTDGEEAQEGRHAHRRRGSSDGTTCSQAKRELGRGGAPLVEEPRDRCPARRRRGSPGGAERHWRRSSGGVARLPVEGAREGGVLTRLGKGADGSCGGEEDVMR